VHDTYKLNYPFFVYEFGIRFWNILNIILPMVWMV
jgi:hypothetical protein